MSNITIQPGSFAYFEGKYVPLEDAKVSIMTHSFLYGTAVFEGIRGYWNEQHRTIYLFRLREHFERMVDSMKVMWMDSQLSAGDLCDVVVELIRRNAPTSDTYVRPTAYKAARRIGPGLENNPTELCVFTVPFGDYFENEGGLKVQISSWRRVEDNAIPARAKIVGAYVNTALAKTDALAAGFDDCIVLSESGHVSEGSAMNLFMVKKGRLVTTPTTENILEGITRDTIIKMAEAELGLTTVRRQIDRSELYTADELFFCGTGAQVAPIGQVDCRPIGNGKPGPLTSAIKDLYGRVCRGELGKYYEWLTAIEIPHAVQSTTNVVAASPVP